MDGRQAIRRRFDLDVVGAMFIPPDPVIGLGRKRENRMLHRRHVALGRGVRQVADEEVRLGAAIREEGGTFFDKLRHVGRYFDTSPTKSSSFDRSPTRRATSTDHPPIFGGLHTENGPSIVHTPA